MIMQGSWLYLQACAIVPWAEVIFTSLFFSLDLFHFFEYTSLDVVLQMKVIA